MTERTQTKWKEKRREENNTEGYFKIQKEKKELGSVLILAGAVLMLGKQKDNQSILEEAVKCASLPDALDTVECFSNNSMNQEERIQGSECYYYIAGAVSYLVYGILEIFALVVED